MSLVLHLWYVFINLLKILHLWLFDLYNTLLAFPSIIHLPIWWYGVLRRVAAYDLSLANVLVLNRLVKVSSLLLNQTLLCLSLFSSIFLQPHISKASKAVSSALFNVCVSLSYNAVLYFPLLDFVLHHLSFVQRGHWIKRALDSAHHCFTPFCILTVFIVKLILISATWFLYIAHKILVYVNANIIYYVE